MDAFEADGLRDRMEAGIKLAKRLGAAGARFAFQRADKIDCGFEAGRLKDTGRKESLSYGVEVLVRGRKGNTSGNRLQDLETLIEKAVTLARVGSVAHFDAYPAPGNLVSVKTCSERTRLLSREKMIEACQQIVDVLKAYDPNLFITCAAARSVFENVLVTSGGVFHRTDRTHWELGAFVQRTTGTDMLFAGYRRGWCDLNEFYDPALIAQKIVTDLRFGESNATPVRGKLPVYVPPETVGQFFRPIFMGTNGRNVAKGDSPLAGMLNEQIFSSSLTIVDNPHQDYGSGSRVIDNYGIPTERQTIFEKGRLKRYLYDLDSAGLAGARPTGNEGCAPYAPMIVPGTRSSEQMLADIKDGLYVRDLIGFGQSNIINGDFSGNVGLGYRIKDGRIVGRVKNTMIAGNLYQLLKKNVLLSSDTEYQGRYPHLVMDGVSVSAP